MPAAPILFVTGKGGTGKSTVARAVSVALAGRGDRVLLVEPYGQTGLEDHFADVRIGREPRVVGDRLSVVRLQPRQLVEEYFHRLLKLPLLARRLLSSSSFNAVTSAAPGVTEFLILDRLESWSRRSEYDRVVVDGPSTGHALQLLRAPFQLAAIARSGPLHRPLRRLIEALRKSTRASVGFVSLCEEMSVAECVEAHDAVAGRLGIAVQRPVLNRCVERRFTRDEARSIAALAAESNPLLDCARLHIAAQQRAAAFATELKRCFGAATLCLREAADDDAVDNLGHILLRGWKL